MTSWGRGITPQRRPGHPPHPISISGPLPRHGFSRALVGSEAHRFHECQRYGSGSHLIFAHCRTYDVGGVLKLVNLPYGTASKIVCVWFGWVGYVIWNIWMKVACFLEFGRVFNAILSSIVFFSKRFFDGSGSICHRWTGYTDLILCVVQVPARNYLKQ